MTNFDSRKLTKLTGNMDSASKAFPVQKGGDCIGSDDVSYMFEVGISYETIAQV